MLFERVPLDGQNPLCAIGAALRDATHVSHGGRDCQQKWVVIGDRRMARRPTASFVGGKAGVPTRTGLPRISSA
eukprot:11135490-Lingulodinium_polyedra.AAC.1